MSCPNWRSVVADRELSGEDTAGWTEAVRHLRACGECWEAALAADPTLLFQCLPAPEITEEELDAMKGAVATMRRARSIEQPTRPRAAGWRTRRSWAFAATLAVVLAGSWSLRDRSLRDGALRDVRPAPKVAGPPPLAASAERGAEPTAERVEPERVDHAATTAETTPAAVAAVAYHEPSPPVVRVAAEEDLELEIQILRAAADGAAEPSRVPQHFEERLRKIFKLEGYELLAGAKLQAIEGAEVLRDLGRGYSVRFELGEILSGDSLKLSGFRVLQEMGNLAVKGRQPEPEELIETTLTLSLGQAFILGLAQNADEQEALMVAITCRRAGEGGASEP